MTSLQTAGRRRTRGALAVALATAGSIALTAAAGPVPTAPVTLVGVSSQGNALVIEASEPVAYVVDQPDPLRVIVELRNVSIASALARFEPRDPIADVAVARGSAPDGAAVARVTIGLMRPVEFTTRSVRNTIRLELAAGGAAARVSRVESPGAALAPATRIDSVTSQNRATSTAVTLRGDGALTPADVSETTERPRRLVLDFANVQSKAAAVTAVDSSLVTKVRVALNSREPLVTRVVMEISDSATYHIEREGGDLSVVFEKAQAASTVMLPALPVSPAVEPEAPLTMEQALKNAAPLSPPVAAAAKGPGATPMKITNSSLPAQAPASAVIQGAPAQAGLQTGERQYTGRPVSIDIENGDLRALIRLLVNEGGLNVVFDPSVQGTIDIVLNEIPWDQALETILRANKLGYVAEGTIVRIAPLSVLAEEEAARQKLAEARALAGDLRVQTFTLSYARAQDMQALITKSALSPRGQIQIDARTNTLIITDLPDRLQLAGNLITSLDRAEPQVEIEARIITTTREFARAVGVQWGLNGRVSPEIGNTTGLAFPNNGSIGGRVGGTQGGVGTDVRANPINETGTGVNLGVLGASSAVGLAMGAVNGAFNLDVALSALERTGKGRILSTPRVTTQNNVEAEITQGVQIPVQTVANNTVTVTFKDAALTLKVTPQITAANTVIMQISLENATPGNPVQGIPSINTQRALTRVQVEDGNTTVMGGVFVSQEQTTLDRTPVLNRIPLLGWLFRRDDARDESRELLIFITPRILKG
jgi:type IV pilus secretin PilQ/predicted competence protein